MLTCQKIREEGYEVPVKTFFEQKTLRRILEKYTGSREVKSLSEVSSESLTSSEKISHFIPLNHVQERILFLSRMTSSEFFRLEFSIPIGKIGNPVDVGLATNTVILGNPLLRSVISRSSGDYQFLLLSATECYYHLNGSERQKPIDNPFFTEIWLSNNHLFLSVHHIICDGRSLQILKNQFHQFFENEGEVDFERNFYQKIDKSEVIGKINKFESIFGNFRFGAKSSRLPMSTAIPGPLATHRLFFAFCRSISEKYKLRPFHVACTFANRSAHNWNTVSMFANTLPVKYDERNDDFETFSNRLSEINSHSNVPLIDIVPNGRFADFAINFHKSIDNSDGLCQFPVLLTYSENENQSILEFDEKSISVEEIEDLKRRILKFLGLNGKIDNLEEIVIRNFQKFITTDTFSESIDFFASGGHSLSAMKLIDNLSEELKIDIPIKLIFDNPTPKSLIQVIREMGKSDKQEISVIEEPIKNPVTSYHYPLSPQQLQMFYLSELTSLSLEYQLPFIQPFKKSINPESIHSALLSTIQEQSIFRTVFRMDSLSVPYQEVLSVTECFIPCHVEYVKSEEELHRKIKELCEQKIDFLDGAPLIRAAFLISDNPGKVNNVAFLHLHHLISDARSTQLMNLSMQDFINGRSQKRMKYQYVDYCREEEKSVDNQEIDNQYLSALVGGAIKSMKSAVINPSKSSITVPESNFQAISTTPFSHFLNVISQILITKLSVPSLNITFPVINRTDKTSGICGYFLNNLIINTSGLSDLAAVIQVNLPYSQVIRKLRKSIDNQKSISDIYINCRYDLEFDESDDDVLLDLVPMKLHFPLEIDMDKVGGAYKITIRSNQFYKEEIREILEKLRNELKQKGAEPANQYIPIHRKDFPNRHSLQNLYQNFFLKSINNRLCPNLPYPKAFTTVTLQSAHITRQFLISRGSLIRSDDVIAIIGRKSIDITLKCLAVQYAGAAYLPIDKDYPENRKIEILKDSVSIWDEAESEQSEFITS